MAEPLPEPTPSEARPLILGTGTFGAGWGVSVATLFVNGMAIDVDVGLREGAGPLLQGMEKHEQVPRPLV